MRNLKRALSLLLSSTMVLGMVVMGGSAAGYQDVDASNDNQEAIEVLQAVGIMSGIDDAGNFNPDGSVTRNQMAVVMAHLLNLDYDYYRGTNTFSDVPEWAAPYVAACVAEGVTAGVGGGLYGGDQKITAAQAGLMVMKALGYFQNQEDFGDDWQIATIRQASYINLFDKVNSNADAALTRGQVAQLVLNGLKSNMVDFTGDKGVQIGDVTVGYHAEYTPKTNAASKYNSIVTGTTTIIGDNGQYYVQLGEELYDGKLKLADGSDDFERPSRVWSYNGQEIGTYAKKELIVETYTSGVTGKDMYNLLSSATINDYDLANYVDGAAGTIEKSDLVRSNNDDLDATGNGVVTEVYVDNQAKEITIVSINNYLAKATSDYSKDKEYAPLNVYVKDTNGLNYNVDVEEVAAVANVTEDTFYQVNISYKNNSTVGEVVAISDVKVLADSTVTKFSTSSSQVSKLTVDGTEYKANEKAFYDADVLNTYNDGLLTNNTYNVYLDANGYFLGVDLYSGESNYVFITGYDLNGSNLYVKTADAGAIFLDGTMKTIKVNVTDTNKNITNATGANAAYFDEWNTVNADSEINEWYTYSVDADGNYTLKPAVRMTWTKYVGGSDQTIRTDNLSIVDTEGNGDRVYGEDATVFLTVDTDDVSDSSYRGITEVTGVYTGVQNVDIEIDTTSTDALRMGQIFTVYDKDWYAIGAVVLGDAMGAQQNLAYILSNAKSEEYKDGTYYWEFDAFMGDSIKTFTAKSKYPSSTILKKDTVQELRFDGEYVTDIKDLSATDFYVNADMGNQINGEAVYQMTGLVKTSNVINLQGRTMYITAGRTDVGLALATNAKAVVIQDENGKTDVKTEFSSVASAISHLADATPATSGVLEYDGDIYAALDSNGVAQWVVFVSDTPLTTGSTVIPPSTSGYTPNATQRGNFLDVKANTATANDMDVYIGAWNWLVNNGYNVLNAVDNTTHWTFMASKGGNSYFFVTNLISVSKITVNGVAGWYEQGATIDNAGTYALYSSAQTLPVADSSGPASGTGDVTVASGTGDVTVAYATHNNRFIYTDLYKVTVDGTAKWYQNGSKITGLKGSVYNLTDSGRVASSAVTAIPSSGIVVTSALNNQTIYPFWSVAVTGETTQYVKDGQDSNAFSTKLDASKTYRTTDGKYVSTDGSKIITAVSHDITITDTTTTYTAATLSAVVSGATDTTVAWTVNGQAASGVVYLKNGDVVVATATTGSTGETTGSVYGKLSGGTGATAAISKAYTTTATPAASGTDVTFTGAIANVKDGVSTFTWTYASGNTLSVSWSTT